MANNPLSERDQLKSALGRRADCLSAFELERYLSNRVDEGRRAAILGHLKACPACETEMMLLSEFQRAELRPEEAEAVRWIAARLEQRSPEIFGRADASLSRSVATPRWKLIFSIPSPRAAALVFASLLVVISAGLFLRRSYEPTLNPNPPAAGEVMRSQAIEILGPVGDLSGAPSELKWQPVRAAAKYEVRLMEVDRSELWKAETESTVLTLPADVREKLLPKRTIAWEVTARSAAGSVLASSGVQQFRVIGAQE